MEHHERGRNTKRYSMLGTIQNTRVAMPALFPVDDLRSAGFFVWTEYLHGADLHTDTATYTFGLINQRGHELAPFVGEVGASRWALSGAPVIFKKAKSMP